MFRVLLISLLLLCGGCSTLKSHKEGVYFEAGVAYQIDGNSDWYVRTTRTWQCSDNFQAHFELGYELPNKRTKVGYHHQSWFSCGRPFNPERPELYQDDIRVTHKWGGR